MDTYGISPQKLFTLSQKSVEKRIRHFYHETRDGKATIELLIAMQVRAELCESELSTLLRGLVHHIFLKSRSTAAMRRYYDYFIDCFDKKDWQLLLAKLFPVTTYAAEEDEHLYPQITFAPLAEFAES